MRKRRERRRLSLTSLIDVIFLLLLFFMLSSTFSRFAEVEIAAAGGGGTSTSETPPMFLRLAAETLSLNGQAQSLETLPDAFDPPQAEAVATPVLISLQDDVNAQRLADLLIVLRGVGGLQVTVLGS